MDNMEKKDKEMKKGGNIQHDYETTSVRDTFILDLQVLVGPGTGVWEDVHTRDHNTLSPVVTPLGHDLESVWKVTLSVFHLKGVCVTDLVVRSSIVCRLHHHHITSWAAQFNGIALTGQLPAEQPKRHRSPRHGSLPKRDDMRQREHTSSQEPHGRGHVGGKEL